jgi:hypothetical protein
MCSTCQRIRKAAFAVIKTVLPKPKDNEPIDSDKAV